MKNQSIQQEILLMPSSTFLQHQYAKKNECATQNNRHLFSEEMERACLSGSIYKMISGIIAKVKSDEQLFLLQVRYEKEFLEIELGEDYFKKIDHSFSISPNYFLSYDMYN